MKTTETNLMYTQYILLTFICLTTIINSNATNYYVASNGNDNNNGTSTSTPWKTITKVNSKTYNPGDSILFRRSDTWRNIALEISSSGNTSQQIVYGAYGEGARPEILGSLEVSGWTNVGGNIWASGISIPNDPWTIGYDGPEIFFEIADQPVSWGVHQDYTAGYTNLTKEFDWTWNNNTIYIYLTSDPASRYSAVEVPQLDKGVYILDHNYVTIDGLAIKYFGDAGIYDQYATIELYGLRVTNCEIAYIGRKEGSAAYGLSVHHSDSYYAYNEIHNCGRRGVSITLYDTNPIIESNIIIEHNHFHHGWHTTSLDCSTSGAHTVEDIYFRNNYVEGSPDVELNGVNPNSNHIFCDEQSGGTGTIRNFYFYNNIFTYAHGSSIKIGTLSNVYIHNNTFYNFNPTLANWQAHVYLSNNTANTTINNNIFYSNSVDNQLACIKIDDDMMNQVSIDRNLYYQSSTGQRFFWVNNGTSYRVDEWDSYKSATGYDANSPSPENPNFNNAPSDFGIADGSPAIGKGIPVTWITHDYYGNTMNTPPDLGAIQYGSVAGVSIIEYAGNTIVYPNPAKDFCKISVSVPSSEKYIIRLLTIQGKEIYESSSYQGPNLIDIPIDRLKPGIYLIYRLSNNQKKDIKKLVID